LNINFKKEKAQQTLARERPVCTVPYLQEQKITSILAKSGSGSIMSLNTDPMRIRIHNRTFEEHFAYFIKSKLKVKDILNKFVHQTVVFIETTTQIPKSGHKH
jgi:hypothetical protein